MAGGLRCYSVDVDHPSALHVLGTASNRGSSTPCASLLLCRRNVVLSMYSGRLPPRSCSKAVLQDVARLPDTRSDSACRKVARRCSDVLGQHGGLAAAQGLLLNAARCLGQESCDQTAVLFSKLACTRILQET